MTRNRVFIIIILAVLALLGAGVFLLSSLKTGWRSSPLDRVIDFACGLRRGRMVSAGCGIAGCTSRCVVSYWDGGRSCGDSGQCAGRCIVAGQGLPEAFPFDSRSPGVLQNCSPEAGGAYRCAGAGLRGACEDWPPANCEYRWELNGEVVKPVSDGCVL